jgi:manganese transport protein
MAGGKTMGYGALIVLGAAVLGMLLAYVWFRPWIARWWRRRRVEAGVGIHAGEPVSAGLADVVGSPYRRVAVALDFSGRDAEILREVVRFLGANRPDIVLMHVVESASAGFLGPDSGDAETQQDAARLQAWAGELGALGFATTTQLGSGRPVPELARMVHEQGSDLVILGAHGHGFLKDLLLGTTADRLRHRVDAHVLVVAKRKLAGTPAA